MRRYARDERFWYFTAIIREAEYRVLPKVTLSEFKDEVVGLILEFI